jgi:hypothetical protein
MAKQLRDDEVLRVIRDGAEELKNSDADQYLKFITDLAGVVAEHFGGDLGLVDWDSDGGNVYASFTRNDNVPENDGVYAKYDLEGEL